MSDEVQARVLGWLVPILVFAFVSWKAGPFLLGTCGIDPEKPLGGGPAPLSPADPGLASPPRASGASIATTLCGGLLDCYANHERFGQITVAVTARVTETGAIAAPKVEGAPPEVATCIEDRLARRELANYDDGGGQVRCQWSGTYMSGSQMMAQQHAYSSAAEKGGSK